MTLFFALIVLGQICAAAPILEKRSFSGDGTFYTVGMGSCGTDDSNEDMVAALNAPQMGSSSNPNNNPNCGRKARVKGPKGSVTVKIVDTCPPCKKGDLDLSPAAFAKIADMSEGRVSISWNWA
ncbi:RlpA-like double-psi beta-barrel-protein domain-containing protein-containing protein [Radiomyces spectabilis]|uniref:RlpA-like double-psi beta-barrel-protein domain-containing protein-containing protein n=1 Tax=Radiomyces spectabilis TaxID=64574 RepID=UPI00221E5BAA|nr:RlpA-like double-psi beta-barrel-protein domain-containing protein-containing protein [Radiomyces spectabilis]KAI8384341.1 RlpA-like double-psi beta-barrel-protein domain-containing protein-containing protein [Radiomyces spectabilis]